MDGVSFLIMCKIYKELTANTRTGQVERVTGTMEYHSSILVVAMCSGYIGIVDLQSTTTLKECTLRHGGERLFKSGCNKCREGVGESDGDHFSSTPGYDRFRMPFPRREVRGKMGSERTRTGSICCIPVPGVAWGQLRWPERPETTSPELSRTWVAMRGRWWWAGAVGARNSTREGAEML